MASDHPSGKPAQAQPRAGSGPRAIGAVLPNVTRAAFRSRSAAAAQLMSDWPAIVGPALAAISAPRQLARGTLLLACAGPVALELQHLSGQLADRINAHYGRRVVEQLRFVQAAIAGPSAGQRAPRPAPPAPVAVPGIADGALRDALADLGGAVAQAAAPRPSRRGLTRTPASEA